MVTEESSFWTDIKRYEDILAKEPASYCFAHLSELYRKLNLVDDAIAVAQRGIAVHPEYAGGYLALGRACYDKGLKKESREALERVVRVTPENVLAQRLLSTLYLDSGDAPRAIATFKTLIYLDPNDVESRLSLESLERSAGQGQSPVNVPLETAPGPDESVKGDLVELEELEIVDELEIVEDEAVGVSTGLETVAEPVAMGAVELAEPEETVTEGIFGEATAEPSSTAPVDFPSFAPMNLEPAVEAVYESEPVEATEAVPFSFDEPAVETSLETSPDFFPEQPAEAVAVPDREEEPVPFAFIESSVPILERPQAASAEEEVPFSFDEAPAQPAAESVVEAMEAREEEALDPFATSTLAELYISQGFLKRALKVYRDLLDKTPDSVELREKIIQLKFRIDEDEDRARATALDDFKAETADLPPAAETASGQPLSEAVVHRSPQEVTAILEGWLANIRRVRHGIS